jgi:hypothetical protein
MQHQTRILFFVSPSRQLGPTHHMQTTEAIVIRS